MINNRYRLIPRPNVVKKNKPQFQNVNTKIISPKNIPVNIPVAKIENKIQQKSKQSELAIPKNKQVKNKKDLILNKKNKSSANKLAHDKIFSEQAEKLESLKNIGIGRILVIIACGPSIKQIDWQNLKSLKNVDIMSINKPDVRLWPTKFWFFCDKSQYNRNTELFNNYNGTVMNPYAIKQDKRNQILFKTRNGQGFSKNVNAGINIGRSSTYASLQMAYYMNYDFVFIFGCDMSIPKEGPSHHYGENPDVDREVRKKRFAKEAESFQFAASNLSLQERNKIIFCSPVNKWPFVRSFKSMEPKEAIEAISKLNDITKI